MTSLETSLRAYAEFLEEQSVELLPDHTPRRDRRRPIEVSEGDVIMFDQLEKNSESGSHEPGGGRRVGMLVAAAAIVVIALLFAAVSLWSEDNNDLDTIDLPAEPRALVDLYYELFEAGDVNGIDALIADDASFEDLRGITHDRTQWLFREAYHLGQATTIVDRDCRSEGEADVGTVVVCVHGTVTADAWTSGGAIPVTTSITVNDGRIAEISERVGPPDYLAVRAPAFEGWLRDREGEIPPNALCCEWESTDDAFAGGKAWAKIVADFQSEFQVLMETHGCVLSEWPCNEEIGIVRSFIEARHNGDAAAATALFGESPTINDLATTVDDYVAVAALETAIGRTFLDRQCTLLENLYCPFRSGTDWSRALGIRDKIDAFEFEFEDGAISSVSAGTSGPFIGVAWVRFEEWLQANHPDDVAVMLEANGRMPILTFESIALWEQHTDEFVAEHSGG